MAAVEWKSQTKGDAGDLGRADEALLLASLRAGRREAAERLAESTYRSVYAALFRFSGNAELAADLTQETYRKAWGALGGFDGRARFTTWLYRIAYTTFLNHVRGPRQVVPFEEHHLAVKDPRPSPEEGADRSAAALRVRRAVMGLPEELRYTVTARYWGELPVREIAEQEGVSTVAIRKRLKRAAALLAAALEEVPDERA
jgi:RNA polymerase sigma-70 factor (ECF subfamily)